MKRLFTLYIVYRWALCVFLPLIYFYVFRGRYVFLYGLNCPDAYIWKAAAIITIPLLIFLLLALLIGGKYKDRYVEPYMVKRVEIYYYIVVAFNIVKIIVMGDYSKALTSGASVWSYLGLLFDIQVAFLLVIFLEKETINIVFEIGAFFLVTFVASSRSGLLTVVWSLALMLMVTRKYLKARKAFFLLILICCIMAPIVFRVTTLQRGKGVQNTTQLMDMIVGRCSYLETLGGALYQADQDEWEEEIFRDKYSLDNQFKQAVNTILPGDLFPGDVNPNQYYRAIFMGYSEEACKNAYTSINLSLSGYLYIKYGFILSIVFTVSLLLLLFLLSTCVPKLKMFGIIGSTVILANLLDYFDWVMLTRDILRMLISIVAFYVAERVLRRIPGLGIKGKIKVIK